MASSSIGALARLVIWLKCVAYPVLVAAVLLFARYVWPLDLLTFAWPYVVIAGVLLIALAAFFGLRMPVALAVLGTALALVPVWLVPTAPAATGNHTLRVMTANLFMESRDTPKAFVAYVREQNADILILDEVRPAWADAVAATGLYPYESSSDLPARDDKKVFSKFPILSETPLIDERVGTHRRRSPVRFEIDRDGAPLTLYAIHPESPRGTWRWHDRNAYFAAAIADAQGRPGDVIAAGDWNTPQWSPYFRETLDAMHLRTTATMLWPPATRFWTKLWPTVRLGVAIDHVAVSDGFAVSNWQMGPHIGSNHFPVTVDLVRK